MILPRYFTREALKLSAAIIVGLFVVYLSTRFATYLGEAAEGKVAPQHIGRIVMLKMLVSMKDLVPMSLMDYAAHASSGAPALAGRQVQLVGFIMAGAHGEPYIVRLVIGCCAAGARPAKVGLTGDLTGVLTPGGWVEVVGTYVDRTDFDPVNGAAIPYLSVVSLSQIPPPTDPYDG